MTWIACADRLPFLGESPNGYFWAWNSATPLEEPFLVESFDRGGVTVGFCHEAVGVISEITHWRPATPPQPPVRG